MSALLEVNNVSKVFGGLTAVDGVSFSLDDGQILGLVGPNGSGKSTMLNILSGVYALDGGSITHRGRKLTGLPPNAIASAGLARTFQNLQIFGGMTVGQNVLVGRTCRMNSTLFGSIVGSPFARAEERDSRERARSLLERVGIERYLDAEPSSLSYGQRRLLEVAHALASEPSVLMLDEPCAGLSAARSRRAILARSAKTKT
jgi:branched-chain amino acid transport system ATP-binding protein